MKKLSALLSLALGLAILPCLQAADAKTPPANEAEAEKAPVGAVIERKAGGFINLCVEGGNFVIKFLDADKKETDANVTQAVVAFRKGKSNERFFMKSAGDGKSLRSPLPVPRPYIFNTVRVVLFNDDENTANEVYVVNFRQPMPGDGEGVPVDEMTPDQLGKIAK